MLNPAEIGSKEEKDLKSPMVKYKRILLKLSGESLMGEQDAKLTKAISLVKALVESDDRLGVSVSHTTRAPRGQEQDGHQ